jgi:hypothetical protein
MAGASPAPTHPPPSSPPGQEGRGAVVLCCRIWFGREGVTRSPAQASRNGGVAWGRGPNPAAPRRPMPGPPTSRSPRRRAACRCAPAISMAGPRQPTHTLHPSWPGGKGAVVLCCRLWWRARADSQSAQAGFRMTSAGHAGARRDLSARASAGDPPPLHTLLARRGKRRRFVHVLRNLVGARVDSQPAQASRKWRGRMGQGP